MYWKVAPQSVVTCCATLWQAGHQAYPVGGCVRDLLLGRIPQDWDITTSALPEQVQELFARTVPTGLAHGTVTVLLEGDSLEVTTFRRELGYSDGRRPDAVSFQATLEEDLSRRDFTINAMALGQAGEIIDGFGGQEDLARKVISCLGDPRQRFQEDGLRMLRGLRFACQLGFSLDGNLVEALADCASLLDLVSAERCRTEIEKAICSSQPQALSLALEHGMLARFGAQAQAVDLSSLATVPALPIPRWRCFCQLTGLDITKLPVERSLRRAVLHPELEELDRLALTGGMLYQLGLRGADISRAQRLLLPFVREDEARNQVEVLVERLRDCGFSFPDDDAFL